MPLVSNSGKRQQTRHFLSQMVLLGPLFDPKISPKKFMRVAFCVLSKAHEHLSTGPTWFSFGLGPKVHVPFLSLNETRATVWKPPFVVPWPLPEINFVEFKSVRSLEKGLEGSGTNIVQTTVGTKIIADLEKCFLEFVFGNY